MNENVNAIKAAIWYTISSFVSKAIIYLCTPLYTRVLTLGEFGLYNNYVSWQAILLAIFAMGLDASVTIAYFDYKDEKKFREFISTIVIASLLFPLVYCVIIVLNLDYFSNILNMDNVCIFLMMGNLCLYSTLNIFQTEQRVKSEYKIVSYMTIFSAVGTVVITMLLIYFLHNKLYAIVLGNILFNSFISFIILCYYLSRTFSFKLEYLKYALVVCVPLIPHVLSGVINGSSGQVLITKFCGPDKTALFGLVYTISMVVTLFTSCVNRAWVPWFFDKIKKNELFDIQPILSKTIILFSWITIGMCLLGPEIVILVGGIKYYEASIVIFPIILHCFIDYIYTIYVNVEFYEKKTFGISVVTVITAVIGFCLNYFLIPRFGYVMAAYTIFITTGLSLLLHLFIVFKMGKLFLFDNIYMFKVLLFTICGCIVIANTYHIKNLRMVISLMYIGWTLFLAWKIKSIKYIFK